MKTIEDIKAKRARQMKQLIQLRTFMAKLREKGIKVQVHQLLREQYLMGAIDNLDWIKK